MALTNQQLTDRVEAIELFLNTLQTAINNMATTKKLNQVLLLRQNEIEALQTRLTSLEAQVEALEAGL